MAPKSTDSVESAFLYVGCQPNANAVCKQTVLDAHPELRFAFSRPGFLTFKHAQEKVPRAFAPRSPFARVAGLSLARVGGDPTSLAQQFWDLAPRADHLHVWARTDRLQRDDAASEQGDDATDSNNLNRPPMLEESSDESSDAALAIGGALQTAMDELREGAEQLQLRVNQPARPHQTIVDCIVVEPDQWWIGWREASSPPLRWVGGAPSITPPTNMVSRAYLKMKEALLWSRLPIGSGQTVAEIGSAPGGSCQALLETGAEVIGIDPAEMDPVILSQPGFSHIRRRGAEVRRKDLAHAQWLCVDSNVAPQHTLDTLAALHEHEQIQFRGMLITLKMPNWKLAAQLDDYLGQIRRLGYQVVKPRHLSYNRQELCVAAARTAAVFRKPRRGSGAKKARNAPKAPIAKEEEGKES